MTEKAHIVILSVNEQNAKFIKSTLRYNHNTTEVHIISTMNEILKLPKIKLLIEGDRWQSHPKAVEIEDAARRKLV